LLICLTNLKNRTEIEGLYPYDTQNKCLVVFFDIRHAKNLKQYLGRRQMLETPTFLCFLSRAKANEVDIICSGNSHFMVILR
jgi:hypothetical protein